MIDTVALREKVLDLAIRGKLVPQDPNDEPASVLLERIRAQKQQMVKDGKLKPKDIKDDSIIFVGEDNLHYEKFADGTVECIEDEIPFELPCGWVWCRLSMVGTTNIGLTYKPADISEEGTIVLRSCNIRNGKIDLEDLVRVKTDIRDNQYIEENDILICARNGSRSLVGKCAVMNNIGEKASFGAFMAVFRSICYRYVYHYFNTLLFRSAFDNDDSKQINQVTQAILRDTMIPLPPFAEQERIISTLDETFALVDLVNEETENIESLIKSTKAHILDLAIRGKLVPQNLDDEPASVLLDRIRAEKEELIKQGKIKRDKKESVIFKGEDNSYYDIILPSNWTWSSISDVSISIADGSHNPPPNRNQGVPLLSAVNIFDNAVNYHLATRWITHQEWEIENKRTKIDIGDVLLTIVGTIGRTAIVKDPQHFALQRSVAVIKPCLINSEYLMFVLQSPTIYEWLIDNAKGNAQLGIYLKDLSKLIVPLPPIQEQRRLVRAIKTLFAQLDTILCSLS